MTFTRNIFRGILTLPVILALALVLGSLVWIQASVSPVAAQEPVAGESVMSIQIVPVDNFSIAAVETAPVFNVGDTFRVSIVAQNVEGPGIFGGQFEIDFDTNHLQAVENSLGPGTELEPLVNPVNEIDNELGIVRYAASRQGNVENLLGDVVLATLSFEAVGVTEPPEGQTTIVHLESAKLGAKGGIEVPVVGLVDLEIIIREDGNVPGKGDIEGKVKVEARTDENQAGHTVTAVGDLAGELTVTTGETGAFFFNNAPADTYTVTANSVGFLATACEDVQHTADDLTTLADVTLLAGDIDDSGEIDITDAVAIGSVFGSIEPQVADLNVDGEVDILDLILMAANFGQTSADNPWLCQSAGS